MGKNRPLTQRDIQKAEEVVREYGGANISYLSREDQENIIKSRYGDIVRGRSVSRMRKEQVYTVAKSVYDRALRIVRQAKSGSLENRTGTFR